MSTGFEPTEPSASLDVEGYDSFVELGRGGFATVYRARQVALERQVAIKVLDRAGHDEASLSAFRRESHLVGDLSWHPHIANILAAGATAAPTRRPYLCFELVEHGSLGDELSRAGSINWVSAVRSAVEVADALAAAHDSGIIHRDVKADNVLIDRLGRSQLADFGIASFAGEGLSSEGVAMTVVHAPPEMITGGMPSAASDVYSLASTLYEMLTGAAPFAQAVGEPLGHLLERIAEDSPPPLPAAAAPPEVANAIAAALVKNVAQRTGNAHDFGRALQHAQLAAGFTPTPMPYCDRSRPLERPTSMPSQPVAAEAPRRSSGLMAWFALAGALLGVGAGVAGGLVLVDQFRDDAPAEQSVSIDAEERADLSLIRPSSVEASNTSGPLALADGSTISFAPTDAADGQSSTSWVLGGDGTGATLTFRFDSPATLRRIGAVPGYSGVDAASGADRFASVRRISRVRWTFDDGTSVEQTFLDEDRLQYVPVSVVTATVTMEILESVDGPLDFVAISETSFGVGS